MFNGDLGSLFALQDQVTARIGNSIDPQMVIVAARESQKRKTAPKVVDLLLQSRALELLPDSLDNSRAIEKLLREVLLIEPNHADAMARLANLLIGP